MNAWAIAAAVCAVAAFVGNALNFWQSREVKMALLQMQISLTTHKLEVFQETKKEIEPLRESLAALDTETATLGVRVATLEGAPLRAGRQTPALGASYTRPLGG